LGCAEARVEADEDRDLVIGRHEAEQVYGTLGAARNIDRIEQGPRFGGEGAARDAAE